MPANRRHYIHSRRQDLPPIPDALSGINGTSILSATTPATTNLLTASVGVPTEAVAPPLFGSGTITVTSSPTSTPSATSSPAAATPQSASHNGLSTGTVVAACIGAFVGAAVIIFLLLLWFRRPVGQKTRARSASDALNAQSAHNQRRDRGKSWNKLGEDGDKWEGMSGKHESQQDIDEKNFGMFKKTNSMRTTRTAKALEEHGFDLPPLQFSPYHPTLAEELAQPEKPFVNRQDSGVSWDGETVGDDSFLSLRSVRVDSGAMSPTLNFAKVTPVATTSVVHKWETAEVVTPTIEGPPAAFVASQSKNPFSDSTVEERRKSGANPFFGAQELTRQPSRARSGSRSRSNSLTSRRSRSSTVSRPYPQTTVTSARTSDTATHVGQDPFSDETLAGIPKLSGHVHTDSSASNPLASEHAMKSLIAALNLTQEEVEERLKVASFHPSISSRYSGVSDITGISSSISEEQDDAVTIRGFPVPPSH